MMKITRNTMRADGRTVGEAMDADAAALRAAALGMAPTINGSPTLDEREEEFISNVRDAVLDALDTVTEKELSVMADGWKDRDLPELFKAVDAHARRLFERHFLQVSS